MLAREDCGVATLEIPNSATAGWRLIVAAIDTTGAVINISTYTYWGRFITKGVASATPMVLAYDSASGGILCTLTQAACAALERSGTFEIGYTDGAGVARRVLRGNFLKVG